MITTIRKNMNWKVEFYNESVEEAILDMPPKIQARMLRLLDLIEEHGANLGSPHTERLWVMAFLKLELRLKKE
jgi:hypothetical protein